MKMQYMKPEIVIIDANLSGVLCVSTPIGDDATETANARYRDWDDCNEE